ncbi:MAG: hypothetical protein Q7T96_16985 [Methylobacter sp.]|nr:hypothetical protein [Methylobacter sp.]
MITKERTQKLDLLVHLLSNLTQALVVCGPEGIGKTTLLKILQERKTESWRYCLIQGNADVSFEAVQEQLVKAQPGRSVQSLSTASGQYKQVVLIIDNAGELVPGLIAAIIQYAAANPVLRVIFSLTHDELQVKRGSDRAIDDCHIVEIPPLSEKQCGDFLQHLSTLPYANLSFRAIDDNMIAHIYRETHGVPGRIIAEISGLSSSAKQGGKLKWILVLAVAAAIVIALGVQWLILSKNNDKKVTAPAAAEQKTDNTDVVPPRPESQTMLALPPVQPVIQQQSVQANEAKDALKPSAEVNVNRNNQQPVTPVVQPETASMTVDKPLTSDAPRSSAIASVSPKTPALEALPPDPTSRDGENAARLPGAVAAMPSSARPLPLGTEQEKSKQLELSKALSKTIDPVEPPIAQNSEIKAQSEPVKAVEGKKQPDVAQQKMADRLWASREKLKQTELKKTVNSMEPFKPNQLETIQIPQKPVEVAGIPEQRVMETATAQQVEPGRIGSLPIATLPPSLAVEASSAPTVNNFTLQLMVLSKQSSADDMFKKYPALAPDIRVIRTIAKGKEKFILEYGSYSDTESANKAKQSLPFEFHRALVRKIAR